MMNGYLKSNSFKSYSKGVAAGFEYNDSSEDEFMFGDDEVDDEVQQNRPKKRGVFDVKPESSTNRPKYQTSAPWLQNENDNTKFPEQDIKTNNSDVRRLEKSVLEDVSIQGEDVRIAVTKGDVEYIKAALKLGFAVDTRLRSEWTGLMYASINAKLDVMKFLLESGANPNFQKDMFTPLMALCSSTSKDEKELLKCADILLSAKARVNAHDRHLMTPVMYAAQNGRPDLVKMLIEHQAEVNSQDTRGWTALAFAANSGHTHVVKVLLNSHANENMCASDGQSPSDLAYAKGYTTLADILENPTSRTTEGLRQEPQDLRQQANKNSIQESRYVTYGDLELFLYGLELGHLVKVFRDHHLLFEDFLKITDKELTEIGISELGVKKKILDAVRGVHVNEWDLSGLSVDKKSKINTLEAAAIMANVAKHLTCIQSSVLYLQNYVNENQEYISKDDPSIQKILLEQCKEGRKVSSQLKNNVYKLHSFVIQKFPRAEERPCDSIDNSKIAKNHSSGKKLLRILGGVTILGLVVGLGYKASEIYSPKWPSYKLLFTYK